MHWLKKTTRIIDGISEWSGRVCVWFVVVLMLVMVFEVITRRFLNSPTVWTFETSVQMYAFHFMMLAAYTQLYKKHISVDIFVKNLSPRTRTILEIITYAVFFFPFLLVLFVEGIYYARESWAIFEVSYTVFAPPSTP